MSSSESQADKSSEPCLEFNDKPRVPDSITRDQTSNMRLEKLNTQAQARTVLRFFDLEADIDSDEDADEEDDDRDGKFQDHTASTILTHPVDEFIDDSSNNASLIKSSPPVAPMSPHIRSLGFIDHLERQYGSSSKYLSVADQGLLDKTLDGLGDQAKKHYLNAPGSSNAYDIVRRSSWPSDWPLWRVRVTVSLSFLLSWRVMMIYI